jgi:hypothetical protein
MVRIGREVTRAAPPAADRPRRAELAAENDAEARDRIISCLDAQRDPYSKGDMHYRA